MREVAFTIEVVELGIGIGGVASIYFGGIRLLLSEMVGIERSAWRLGRSSRLARPGLVIHAGCMPELAADSSEYTVLLRSRPGARVRRGYYMDVTDFPDGLGVRSRSGSLPGGRIWGLITRYHGSFGWRFGQGRIVSTQQ